MRKYPNTIMLMHHYHKSPGHSACPLNGPFFSRSYSILTQDTFFYMMYESADYRRTL